MIERYLVLAARIRQELTDVERVIERAERAMAAARQRPDDQDLYLDSVALNLHDFYVGLERLFHLIATTVDRSLPDSAEWHHDLLHQMSLTLPQVRPQVLSAETISALSEYLGFRHVVRNVYTFQFEPERLEHLVSRLRSTFAQVRGELEAFARVLEQLAQ
jgi:hypothetical protein